MLTLSLLTGLALADIPPPPGYVEPCTVALQQRPGEVCESCDGWHGGREPCEALEAKGYQRRCRTAGASTWEEVLCKDSDKPVTPVPPVDPGTAIPEVPVKEGRSTDVIPPKQPPPPDPIAPPPTAKSSDCSTVPASGGVGLLFVSLGLLALRRRPR